MRASGLRPSPEFELVLACVRWPAGDGGRFEPSADGVADGTPAADGAYWPQLNWEHLNWAHLVEIARCHQVVSLVARRLAGPHSAIAAHIPEPQLRALSAGAAANAQLCFQRTSEVVRLTRLFAQGQLPLRVFKGIPLAMLAFGDPTLRDAGDVDLLVRQQDVDAAAAVLSAAGYVRAVPRGRLTPRQERSYRAHQKDFAYDHAASGLALDLHWRLYRSARLTTHARLEELPAASLMLGSETIPTLPIEDLFLYLCVHGALDGWLRIKWLADIGALASSMPAAQLEEMVGLAARRGVLAEVSAALLLAHRLLGSPLAAGCLDERDRRVGRILRFATRLIAANDFCPVREQVPNHAWFLHELALRRSWAYRADLVQRSLFRPRLLEAVRLPDALFPLYALLSPAEWLVFRLRRAAAAWRSGREDLQRAAALGKADTPGREGPTGVWRRLLHLSPAGIAMLVEAGILLGFFRLALRLVAVQRLVGWMGRDGGQRAATAEELTVVRRIEWAIGAIVRHAPVTFVCFPQSLAAYFMLRRRRIPSRLFYGVARAEHDQLQAHTWIKVGERTVVGGEAEAAFTVLTSFP